MARIEPEASDFQMTTVNALRLNASHGLWQYPFSLPPGLYNNSKKDYTAEADSLESESDRRMRHTRWPRARLHTNRSRALAYRFFNSCQEGRKRVDPVLPLLCHHDKRPKRAYTTESGSMNPPNPQTLCLLDDILREIYFAVAEQEPPHTPEVIRRYLSDTQTPRPPLGWIRLTHLSRQWREVGIDTPTLWARAVCIYESDDAVNTIRQRARGCPYTIQLERDYATKRRCEMATQFLDRVAHLSYTRKFYKWHWAAKISGKELPLLRSLNLESTDEDADIVFEPLVAPDLRMCALDLDLPLIAPNLLHLSYIGTPKMTFPTLLARLATFTNLVQLTITSVPDADGRESSSDPVHLPFLRYLNFSSTTYTRDADLLRHLRFPVSTSMFLGAGYGRDSFSQDECQYLVDSITAQLRHPSRNTLRIVPDPACHHCIQILAPDKPMPVYGVAPIDVYAVDGITIEPKGTPLYDMLGPITAIVGANITTLVIQISHLDNTYRLATVLLAPLRNVTELHLSGRSSGILPALAPLRVHSPAGSSLTMALPSLKTLIVNPGDDLKLCDGEVPWMHHWDTIIECRHEPEIGAGWLDHLPPVLLERAQAGSPLMRLVIVGSSDCQGIVNKSKRETCARVDGSTLVALRECMRDAVFVDERA
ncbi:unnamed protein product [Peniophora sp. CBMAI 1063]|nr:unnamed protein product [Peniophora sp. CBMAI 1063]